jgi:preprotein translocase subunit Sec61beta
VSLITRALAGAMAVISLLACSAPNTIEPTGSPKGTAASTAEATPTPSSQQAEHAVGVRTIGGVGEFYDRLSNQVFVPRGVNYVYIPVGTGGGTTIHLLKVGQYDPGRTRADFAGLAAAGYNTVRVFLDQCNKGEGCIGATTGSGLNPAYLDNIADLTAAAKETGVVLLLTSNDLPDQGGYSEQANSESGGVFAGYRNSYYLTKNAVEATKGYWSDLVGGLVARHAAFDAVLAWELLNEQWMFADQPPLSLTSGTVSTTTGTYDMADPAAKAKMVSEGLIHYIAEMRGAILALDPTALVTMGFFVPKIAAPDWYVETAPLLKGADLDFFDFHGYPGGASVAKHAELFGMAGYTAKPIVLGEYGAFRHVYDDLNSAERAVAGWLADSCAAGFDGWLYWAYYPAAPDVDDRTWGFTDENGALMNLFAPKDNPDPCVPIVVANPNVAFGKPVKASAALPDQPPSNVVDENSGTTWIAGAGPPQWIQINLDGTFRVSEIRLLVVQSPAGKTVHRLLLRRAGSSTFELVHTFSGQTDDGSELVFTPSTPLANVQLVRVETVTSPSWVAWKEIRVVGEPAS